MAYVVLLLGGPAGDAKGWSVMGGVVRVPYQAKSLAVELKMQKTCTVCSPKEWEEDVELPLVLRGMVLVEAFQPERHSPEQLSLADRKPRMGGVCAVHHLAEWGGDVVP
jgi:hypothetical protein